MNDLVEQILDDLESLGAYFWHSNADSAYIRFSTPYLGSLRISNHEGRQRYRYKWNLRYDFVAPMVKQDDGVTRRYYPIEMIDKFYEDIKNAAINNKTSEKCK